jgi:multidrug resistance efflux pump
MLVFTVSLAVAVTIWVTRVTPPTLVGQVEAIQANVTSTQPGKLTQLQVTLFKKVYAGDPVATVITTDPKVLESSLAVIKAEVGLLRVGMDPMVNRERNAINYAQLRLDWLAQRVQLATARVRLHYAEAECQRIASLYEAQTNLVSRADYDIAVRDRDAARVEVEAQGQLVAEAESSVRQLDLADPAKYAAQADETLRAAMAVQEKRLQLTEAQLSPVTLTAPIEGVVSVVYRRSGENIVAGEPLVTITSTQPEKIIAYLPEPLSLEPEVGMQVRVTTRGIKRTSGTGRVREVAQHMAPIPPTLLLAPLGVRPVQMGLPVDISIPIGLKVRVGELVNLTFL